MYKFQEEFRKEFFNSLDIYIMYIYMYIFYTIFFPILYSSLRVINISRISFILKIFNSEKINFFFVNNNIHMLR